MDVHARGITQVEEMDLRRGPWTMEEDLLLVNYISNHGEGRWNSLARCAGLKRTGKSCRLRWLNYLRPDVRRGNITPEEQLLILELHSRWGNKWSKIAQQLPGRTDNEIKNYWRTRVQKHAKQLRCEVDSEQFRDVVRYLWMPRLLERIQAARNSYFGSGSASSVHPGSDHVHQPVLVGPTPENSCTTSDSLVSHHQMVSGDYVMRDNVMLGEGQVGLSGTVTGELSEGWDYPVGGEESSGVCWSQEDFWFLQQQLCDGI
ncbi:hypothetical protein QJS10_CPA16g01706 [Acorus calamus]|uniref:Uncharacterized protein n=1 Tax=Acorus calamus TaxID=4465 RepID=A0AAV9D0H4_ACOCL|nr:hypothetical protein QJS10_CPA16g01706 [Acorus calamus]